MNYRLDLYRVPRLLTDVHLVDVVDGRHAVDAARDDLAASGGEYAEVFQVDGLGEGFYYRTVTAGGARC